MVWDKEVGMKWLCVVKEKRSATREEGCKIAWLVAANNPQRASKFNCLISSCGKERML